MNIAERKAEFADFLNERMPVLFEFGRDLGYDAAEFLQQPHLYVERLSEWFATQEIEDDDQSWIQARIGYFIGELFATEMIGAWMVCEHESSPFCGRYVIGQFEGTDSMIDPITAAYELVSTPPPRSLSTVIDEMKAELATITPTDR